MKKRTKLIIDAGAVAADDYDFNTDLERRCDGSPCYFCNALHALCHDEDYKLTNRNWKRTQTFFNSLYMEDAYQDFRNRNPHLNSTELKYEFSDFGFFEESTILENQEHRLMAIAFAAAVSETEKE